MSGRHALPRHYPARPPVPPSGGASRRQARGLRDPGGLLLCLLLVACASAPAPVEVGEASEAVPLTSPRTGAPSLLDLRSEDVLMQAMGLIGSPYRYGGTTPRGFDCSGFTSYVFRESVGVQLPRTASEQYAAAGQPVAREALVAGDLVFFRQSGRRIDHVGIYVGEGRFIHAPSRGGRVRIDALSNPHWTRTYQGARRLLRPMP